MKLNCLLWGGQNYAFTVQVYYIYIYVYKVSLRTNMLLKKKGRAIHFTAPHILVFINIGVCDLTMRVEMGGDSPLFLLLSKWGGYVLGCALPSMLTHTVRRSHCCHVICWVTKPWRRRKVFSYSLDGQSAYFMWACPGFLCAFPMCLCAVYGRCSSRFIICIGPG